MSRHRALRAAAAAAFSLGILSACSGVPKPGISNGSVSACFRAIPAARAAVHDPSAHMIGLHRLPADKVEARLHPTTSSTLPDQDTTVCAVVFKGSFHPGQVALAPPKARGRYAVVLVTSKKLKLLAAFVVNDLPRNLGRRFL